MTTLKMSIKPELETGATVQDAAKDLLTNAPERAKDGWLLKSISHALDPEGGDKRWSILCLYQKV